MLVRTIEQIKEFTPVNVSLEYDRVKPILYEVENRVTNLIGVELYNALDNYITTPTDPVNAYYESVIKLLRSSIAWLLFDVGYDILNTQFSNQGFHRIEVEQGGKKTLFQRQELMLRKSFRETGNNRLDQVLAYLENNSDQFTQWKNSTAYTAIRDNYIWTTKQYSDIININNSRLVFQRLKQNMMTVSELYVQPLIGEAMHLEILDQISTDTLSTANSKLLKYLQKGVAFTTMANAGMEFIMQISEMGLHVISTATNTDNTVEVSLPPMQVINDFLKRASINGESYFRTTESFLKLNSTDYPLYTNSTAAENQLYPTFKNEGKIFLV